MPPNFPPNKRRFAKQSSSSDSLAETVRAYEEAHRQLPIVKTTHTPSGQILDWIPIESQVAKGRIATPPPDPKVSALVADPIHQPATFEMHDRRNERGPAGTVPVLRRDLSRLAATDDGRAFARKRKVDGRHLMSRSSQAPADPDPFGYYHTTSGEFRTSYGCQSVLNMWAPACQLGRDHSLSQFGIQNYDNKLLQSLEAGWGVSPDQYGDSQPHLFIYYTTNGYTKDADNVGGYNQDWKGWVQVDTHIFPGALINGISIPGGTQHIITIKFQLYQGNWWFQVQGVWMGYYPASLFQGTAKAGTTLADHGDWTAFWGEVYSDLADPTQTTSDMGSGKFAEEGWTRAAYQRNTLLQTDRQGTLTNSNGTTSFEDATYYDIQTHLNSGTSWGSYFWFGGPGRVPRYFPKVPKKQVTVILGGADGTLITIDANGHIKIVPSHGPGDPELLRALEIIYERLEGVGQLAQGTSGIR